MIRRIQKKLVEWNMVSKNDVLLVGVSGGADSVALLLLLHALKDEMEFSLEVVHVEHGIRGEESVADEMFVKNLCARLNVPCHEERVDVLGYSEEYSIGIEEAARILRYDVFARLAQEKNAKIALAHHMEDNAETVLFQMARGSSLTGLSGIQPVRKDENGVVYIRPLLFFRRSEIEAFLQEENVEYCMDSTNADLTYHRNYIRHEVLPKLAKVNSKAVAHINQSAQQLSLLKDYLDIEVEKYWNVVVLKEDDLKLDVKELLKLHKVLQQEIVYRALAFVAGVKKDISFAHVDEVLALCLNQSGKQVHLPYKVVAKKEYDTIRLYVEEDGKAENEKRCVVVSEQMLGQMTHGQEVKEIILGEMEKIRMRVFPFDGETSQIPQKPYTKWMDYDKIREGFCIRTRQSGDYFISDVLGHRKKLKQYFIDEKIPATEREQMWLLAQEQTVLWLVGGRMSEHIKVTQDTKTIVELEYTGGK